MISMIAAVDENNGLGKNNELLWSYPEDMKFFKKMTMGKVVVMGRKTYESIGKTLKGRTNIVISRDWRFNPEGVHVMRLESVCSMSMVDTSIIVIGGGEIYRQMLPYATTIYLTRIPGNYEADTFFPEMSMGVWKLTNSRDGNHGLIFETWERKDG